MKKMKMIRTEANGNICAPIIFIMPFICGSIALVS